MSPSRYLDLQRPGDPEFSGWDRDIIRAFQQWEAGCCPQCGTPHSEGLWDDKKSPAEQAKWLSGFSTCVACNAMEFAQHKQHLKDEKRREKLRDGEILTTRGRLWSVWRDNNGIQPRG